MNDDVLALRRLGEMKLDELDAARETQVRLLEAAPGRSPFAFDEAELVRMRKNAEARVKLLEEELGALVRACELLEEVSRH